MQEQARYSQFKKALARSDQLALEQLFIYANLHVAEAAYTAVLSSVRWKHLCWQ
jgi:hypothetical protein